MTNNKFFYPANVLLPKSDFENWSVIACDQYTSEPEYWNRAETIVGDNKSALNIILPEVKLSDNNDKDILDINNTMAEYINSDTFNEFENSFVYVERTQSDGLIRRGILGCIDLEDYEYTKCNKALIRATEATVIERIPPRVKIRENAPLELPHVMLLVDDKDNSLFELLSNETENFESLYDFELMQNAGHIKGWRVSDSKAEEMQIALEKLNLKADGLLFCVGDGNHSLATAKECYIKNPNPLNRYALVEVVNIHDNALQFEPIYRIVFGANPDNLINSFLDCCGGVYEGEDAQKYTCVYNGLEREISVKPIQKLAVGTLQKFLDDYILENPDVKIDYIHGEDSLKKLSENKNAVGFLFEGMQKRELFDAVKADGSLPRKTFSMGHADDKRFYLEARKIK